MHDTISISWQDKANKHRTNSRGDVHDTGVHTCPSASDETFSVFRKACCPCGGGCPTCQAKSNDLKVSQPNDPAEIEADQIADKIMRMPADAPVKAKNSATLAPDKVHAKCNECEEYEQEGSLFRKEGSMAAADPPPNNGMDSVKNVVNSGGIPLDYQTRNFFEPRFGTDLSRVRIHTGDAASQSARAINAKAYTLGSDIVFDGSHYSPQSESGKALLAHELAHVGQQHSRNLSPKLFRQAATETAEAPASAVTDEAAPEDESYTDRLARESIEEVSIQMARVISTTSPVPVPETILAALVAAEVSFLYRSYERLVERGEGWRILGRITELLHPSVFAEYCARLVWGLIKGLFSPITGLVHLAIGAISLTVAAVQWLDSLPTRLPGLVSEALELNAAMERFGTQASTLMESLATRENMLTFAGGIFEAATSASDTMEHYIVRGAQAQGRSAADSLATHFLETPLPELAETAGEIIGTVIIELVILIFTDGIGNLITKLGEFARALRPLSRGVVAFTEVAIRAGRIIAQIEHLIGVLLSRTVLRPLMPLFEALEPLLVRLRSFTQRLIGIGEGSATALAGAGAGALEEGAGAATRATERVGAGHPPPRPTPPRRPPPEPVIAEPPPPTRPVEPATEPRLTEPTPEPQVTEPVPEPRATGLDPEELAELGPVNDDTIDFFREHPDQLHAWAEHPGAAAACKLCSSPCFPNMSPPQIQRMEDLMRDLDRQGLVLEDIEPDPAGLIQRLKTSSEAEIDGILDGLDNNLDSVVTDVAGTEIDPADPGLTPRVAWESPSGATPRPLETASQAERIEWMRERLQMHVDEAIEHYRIEGLTPAQDAALINNPHMLPAFRGSRIDQFAKDTIMQDLELADVITAPDFVGEPDILSSILPEWFDITTEAAWLAHLQRYQARYGAGILLPTR